MPTLIAEQNECNGLDGRPPRCTTRSSASCRATKPPQMLAVRVPPSACSTSQSTITWRSPSAFMSHAARSERPINRWISTVRPLCLPLAASRSMRSGDAPGSIEYSAVTHPLPLPRIQRGTSSSTLAVHSTRVLPNVTSTEPSAISVKSRWNEIGRSSSAARPSGRGMRVSCGVGCVGRGAPGARHRCTRWL